ncbi:MAG: glycosyltransferase family 2 protein [Thermoleophilaceae bacterium]
MTDPATRQTARTAVIVPCYEDGDTLQETVASVRDQEPCELVVVDDGSQAPETLRILEELESAGVTVVRQENRGVSAARMKGVAVTSAPYVFPLDADDTLVPGALTSLADVLDARPDLAAVWGFTEVFGDVTYTRRRRASRIDPWRLTYFNGLPYTALLRRTALLGVGGWQVRGGYEDWDLWMALAERGFEGSFIKTPATRYRVHGSRMWREAAARHDRIHEELRRRHLALFARRRRNWRRSAEPWRVKLVVPVAGALPISARNRTRLFMIVDDPAATATLVWQKLRRARG